MAKKNWYVVHVHSGSENKVAEAIHDQAKRKGLEEFIEDVLVPTEEVVEVKKGEKVKSERKFFPGYILVHVEMSDEVWHLIKNTPKVTGFLGSKGKPSPVSQREVDKVVKQLQEIEERPRHMMTFEIGEKVRVCDGPFNSFTGLVEEVDQDKARLKVSVSIFGRSTPVELEFTQVEKI